MMKFKPCRLCCVGYMTVNYFVWLSKSNKYIRKEYDEYDLKNGSSYELRYINDPNDNKTYLISTSATWMHFFRKGNISILHWRKWRRRKKKMNYKHFHLWFARNTTIYNNNSNSCILHVMKRVFILHRWKHQKKCLYSFISLYKKKKNRRRNNQNNVKNHNICLKNQP